MKSKLITFGCSHTEGYYYEEGPGLILTYNQYYHYHNQSLPPIWPTILAEKLGLDLLNLGKGGVGNDSILRIFGLNLNHIQKGDTVIYQVGQNVRIPFAHEGEMCDMLVGITKDHWYSGDIPFEHAHSFFINRDRNEWTDQVLFSYLNIVDTVIRAKSANLWFWGDDTYVVKRLAENKEIWSLIGEHRWIKEPGEALLGYLSKTYDNARIREETKGEIQDAHMGKYGHQLQAQYMYDFIEKTKHLQ